MLLQRGYDPTYRVPVSLCNPRPVVSAKLSLGTPEFPAMYAHWYQEAVAAFVGVNARRSRQQSPCEGFVLSTHAPAKTTMS